MILVFVIVAIAWNTEMCINCDKHGHCPMRFWDRNQHVGTVHRCLCHEDFNHCVVDLDTDIPDIDDVEKGRNDDGEAQYDVKLHGTTTPGPTTTTTTLAPEVVEALGFDVGEILFISSRRATAGGKPVNASFTHNNLFRSAGR